MVFCKENKDIFLFYICGRYEVFSKLLVSVENKILMFYVNMNIHNFMEFIYL